jgi:hypothetical protein
MITNVIAFLQHLTARFRPRGTPSPVASHPSAPAPGGCGLGQASQGNQRRQSHGYEIRPLVNGSVETWFQEISKKNGALSVDVTDVRVPTGNGTVVKATDVVLICAVCGLPSEVHSYCRRCAKALCLPHSLCTRMPHTGEVLRLCPACSQKLYEEWNTWLGSLEPPVSPSRESGQTGGG